MEEEFVFACLPSSVPTGLGFRFGKLLLWFPGRLSDDDFAAPPGSHAKRAGARYLVAPFE
jgi:hypothetical protein